MHSTQPSTCYGIDLGTTYTLVASVEIQENEMSLGEIPVRFNSIKQHSPLAMDPAVESELVASVFGIDADGRAFVGQKLYELKGHPHFEKDINLFYHWKLDLGVRQKPLYQKAVSPDIDDASKVAGKILNYCRLSLFTQAKDMSWGNVILTVPASFQDSQRKDVLQAAHYAKIEIKESMLVDEPNAALIGYLNEIGDEERTLLITETGNNLLVIDFGGGTCDLSVLNIRRDKKEGLVIKNLAISRYNDLGGQDIDMLLAEDFLLEQLATQHKPDDWSADELEKEILPQLSVIAEKLKILLSSAVAVRFGEKVPSKDELDKLEEKLEHQSVSTRNGVLDCSKFKLEASQVGAAVAQLFSSSSTQLKISGKHVHSVYAVIMETLKKANLSKQDLHFILLAGGSVKLPFIRYQLLESFPLCRLLLPPRPEKLVAAGAAICSYYKYVLGKALFTPIISESIEVLLAGEKLLPLIKAGSALPARIWMPLFRLQSEGQRQAEVPFCIGSKEHVVGILRFAIPSDVSTNDLIEMDACISEDKIFHLNIIVNERVLAVYSLINPHETAFLSEEEKILRVHLSELARVRETGDRNSEKRILRCVIMDYLEVNSYTRLIEYAKEYMNRFDDRDVWVLNMLYIAYGRTGRMDDSRMALEKALSFDPNNSMLLHNYSILIEMKEGVQAAYRFLVEKVGMNPSGIGLRLKMALLAYRLNEIGIDEIGRMASEYESAIISDWDEADYHKLEQIFKIAGRIPPLHMRTSAFQVGLQNLLKIQ